jgi:hypothetical protein
LQDKASELYKQPSSSYLTCSTGAHVTIFARRQKPLKEAKAENLAASKNSSQEINAVSVGVCYNRIIQKEESARKSDIVPMKDGIDNINS